MYLPDVENLDMRDVSECFTNLRNIYIKTWHICQIQRP